MHVASATLLASDPACTMPTSAPSPRRERGPLPGAPGPLPPSQPRVPNSPLPPASPPGPRKPCATSLIPPKKSKLKRDARRRIYGLAPPPSSPPPSPAQVLSLPTCAVVVITTLAHQQGPPSPRRICPGPRLCRHRDSQRPAPNAPQLRSCPGHYFHGLLPTDR